MTLPGEVLDRFAQFSETSFNGTYATIPATTRDDVLAELSTLGYPTVEEPGLADLVDARS